MESKKKYKEKEAKKVIKYSVLTFASLIFTLCFVSIGFALYSESLFINSSVKVGTQGKFAITSVTLIDSTNVKPGSIPSYTDDSINFNLTFEKSDSSNQDSYMAKYEVIVTNNTFYDYNCQFDNFMPIIKNSRGEEVDSRYLTYSIDGINIGESIKAGEVKNITLTINFEPEVDDTYTVEGEMEPELIEKPHGEILASLPQAVSGDLTKDSSNDYIDTTIDVISTFKGDKEASITINNTNFEITDTSNNPITNYIIKGESETSIPVRIRLKSDAKFDRDSITTGITLTYTDGYSIDCGNITISVDIDEDFIDTEAPIISNVNAVIQNATSSDVNDSKVGSIKVSWSVDDEEVDHYTVILYKVENGSNIKVGEYTTTSKSYTVDGLEDGDYFFTVYGTDSSSNSNTASLSDIENATTNPGYASRSTVSSYDWHYTVTTTLTYVRESDTVKKVNRGYDYTTTVTPEPATTGCNAVTYYLPASITVVMGGENIGTGTSSGSYSYNGSQTATSANIVVYGVTGDLNITVQGTRS